MDTIAAIATAPGQGGIGIIRVSGPQALLICEKITGLKPKVRQATYAQFKNFNKELIDTGLILYFSAPASFTGEEVVEFQIHGGPVVLNMLLQETLKNGARMARPGEFSERAFLNEKIDLIQAEAIADIITAGSQKSVLAAQRSLQGLFSESINSIFTSLVEIRVWIESAIDFPEEEIDFLSDQELHKKLSVLNENLHKIIQQSQNGLILNKGISIAIVGIPNAGKSSLLNLFTEENSAIVSNYAGTTRDIIKKDIQVNGIPVQLIDTAGIHETKNPIEKEGISRARKEASQADIILWVIDATVSVDQKKVLENISSDSSIIPVVNKVDLDKNLQWKDDERKNPVFVSALTGIGKEELKKRIFDSVIEEKHMESTFSARTRHMNHLIKVKENVKKAFEHLKNNRGELSAEDLRLAQEEISHLTGQFTSDDLLGQIFSSFCIGK